VYASAEAPLHLLTVSLESLGLGVRTDDSQASVIFIYIIYYTYTCYIINHIYCACVWAGRQRSISRFSVYIIAYICIHTSVYLYYILYVYVHIYIYIYIYIYIPILHQSLFGVYNCIQMYT
jgi:hypothetical protein